MEKLDVPVAEGDVDWETTFDCIPDLIAILDSRHRVVKVNKAMAKALNATPQQCVGLQCYRCVHGMDHPPPYCPHLKTLKDGKEHIEEVHEPNIGGDFIVSTTPIVDKSGGIRGTVHIARNITERKKMEQSIQEYALRLEEITDQLKNAQEKLVKSERFAAIGELATILGHDLRNPLAALKYAAYYLKKENANSQEKNVKLQDMVEAICRSVDHSEKIVSDLLCYAGDLYLELKENCVNDLVKNSLLASQVPETINVLNRTVSDIKVNADKQKLQLVFESIIKNAVEAMPNGGSLQIRSLKIADEVAVSFSDTGTGIPDQYRPKIFSPLFSTKAQGMGFSLAISKRIVEAHGGEITFKTALDQGTTFMVILPLKDGS